MNHPGPELKAMLKHAGFKQEAIATRLNVGPTQFSEILSGKRSMTPKFCLALEKAFGVKAIDWYRKQADHDLEKARAVFSQ